jgi:DNA polymerase I-like protein with 3'-5' exonuclease and polymerase domains
MDALVWKGAKIPNGYGRWRHNYGVKEMKHFSDAFDYKTRVERMTRQCTNYPIQSTPADIAGNIAIALGDVWGVEYEDWKSVEAHVIAYDICGGIHPSIALRDMGVKMLNLVHDSGQFEVLLANLQEAAKLIELVMERLPWEQLKWWLPVDLKAGAYWGAPGNLLEAA